VTLTRPFQLDVGATRLPAAVMADAQLAGHLVTGADPVLAAHHLVADLSQLFFDSPGVQRGVSLVTPLAWDPPAEQLDALLRALTGHPLLRPATVDALFETVEAAATGDGDPLVRQLLTEDAAGPSARYSEALAGARQRVAAFATMTDPTDPRLESWSRRLLVASAEALEPGDRRAYIDRVDAEIDDVLAQVDPPRQQSVTLTAREGEIPITLTTSSDRPLRVLVRLESDKLDFPDGDTQVVTLDGDGTAMTFTVRARTPGAFKLQVVLTSPDGRLPLSSGRLEVRSTAVSGVGVVLSVGAGAFLLLWWMRSLRRDRRARREGRARGRSAGGLAPEAAV
jgi:hypothetical protein